MNASKIKQTLIGFTVGSVAVAFFGLFLGYIFGDAIISDSGEYFGELTNSFSTFFILPIPVIIFWIIGASYSNHAITVVPIVAYSIAQWLEGTKAINFFAAWLPIDTSELESNNTIIISSVMLSYVLAFSVMQAIARIYAASKLENESERNGIYGGVFIFLIVSAAAFGFFSAKATDLYASTIDARYGTVHLPSGEPFEQVRQYSAEHYYLIIDKTLLRNYVKGDYFKDGQLTIDRIETWWNTDLENECPKEYIENGRSRRSAEYRETPYGHRYRYLETNEQASSNAPDPESWKEYSYCFIIDSQSYRLTMYDAGTGSHLNDYPVEDIIDRMYASEPVPNPLR